MGLETRLLFECSSHSPQVIAVLDPIHLTRFLHALEVVASEKQSGADEHQHPKSNSDEDRRETPHTDFTVYKSITESEHLNEYARYDARNDSN